MNRARIKKHGTLRRGNARAMGRGMDSYCKSSFW